MRRIKNQNGFFWFKLLVSSWINDIFCDEIDDILRSLTCLIFYIYVYFLFNLMKCSPGLFSCLLLILGLVTRQAGRIFCYFGRKIAHFYQKILKIKTFNKLRSFQILLFSAQTTFFYPHNCQLTDVRNIHKTYIIMFCVDLRLDSR